MTVISQNPKAEWAGIDPHDESELPNLDAEICVGGIYLRLLVANPGWILRKPKEILGELLEAALQGLQKEGVRLASYNLLIKKIPYDISNSRGNNNNSFINQSIFFK